MLAGCHPVVLQLAYFRLNAAGKRFASGQLAELANDKLGLLRKPTANVRVAQHAPGIGIDGSLGDPLLIHMFRLLEIIAAQAARANRTVSLAAQFANR